VLYALAVVLEGLRAVAKVNRAVEVGVGLNQRRRHCQRVVKIGQRRVGKFLARVRYLLRGGYYCDVLVRRRLVSFLFGPHRHPRFRANASYH
jgi:hypothetical protein